MTGLRKDWVDAVEGNLGDRHVCYIALKGSRLFGISEPLSDVDLRVIFKEPTQEMLALRKPQHTIERMHDWECSGCNGSGSSDCEVCDGVGMLTIDFVAYEAERFMHHLLGHNGNFVEALLVPEGYYWADEHGVALRRMAPRFLTQRLYNFYRGYAQGQLSRSKRQERTRKNILYVFREMYAGYRLLRHGDIIFPWAELRAAVEAEVGESDVLRRMENRKMLTREEMTDGDLHLVNEEWQGLNDLLDLALDRSILPTTYDGTEALNNLLLRWRSEGWK